MSLQITVHQNPFSLTARNHDQRRSRNAGQLRNTGLNPVQAWVGIANYQGFEPFDDLSSCARLIALGCRFVERLIEQFFRKFPLNLRPVVPVNVGRAWF
jgi:hypothetical protein